jgi:hypothetical protein
MKKKLLLMMGLSLCLAAGAQAVRLGQFGFIRPAGYLLQDNPNCIFYNKQAGKQYSQLLIYPLEKTSLDADACFRKQWDFFARNPDQGIADPETVEVDSVDGWTYTFGAARGSYNGQMFALTLSSRYKKGLTYYVASVFSEKKFIEDAQAFFNSVEPLPDTLLAWENKMARQSVTPPAPPQFHTGRVQTEFDDGWTSTYIGPYVIVSKENLQAWIFPVNDSLDKVERKSNELSEDKYWRYAVDQFFQTRNVAERPWEMSGTGSDKIFEAEVKNKQTGEESFVAMRLIWNSGSVQTVLAFAPTREQMYKSVFAQYNSFEQVLAYNKFIPTPQMLQGTWQSIETGGTGSYSVAGGFQGSNNKVRFKNVFTFNADGSYQSYQAIQRYVASDNDGMGRNYKGIFSMEGETLQLTGRDKGDPGVYDCWMEAMHGGLALIMVNRKFTGQRYMLFRN